MSKPCEKFLDFLKKQYPDGKYPTIVGCDESEECTLHRAVIAGRRIYSGTCPEELPAKVPGNGRLLDN